MKALGIMFTGFLGLIAVVMFMSVIIMWFCVPILMYQIMQSVRRIEERLKK